MNNKDYLAEKTVYNCCKILLHDWFIYLDQASSIWAPKPKCKTIDIKKTQCKILGYTYKVTLINIYEVLISVT